MAQSPTPSFYCRLCVKSCNDDQQNLYDETGQANENRDLVGKYFTNTMLNMEWEKRLQYICGKCWQHISKFQQFQASIIEAQKEQRLNREKAKEVDELKLKPELNLNINQQELKLHITKRLGANTEDLINPTALAFAIKTEEPLDLNNDYKDMSSQEGQQHFTHEEISLMSHMSSRKESQYLMDDNESNEDYSSNEDMPLSSFRQTSLSSSDKKVKKIGTKKSAEEFDAQVALWRSSLECDICHQLVASYSQLKEHFSKYHASEDCYLMCCQLRLETRYDIDRHIYYHNAPQQLKCETCCKAYRWMKTLRSHNRIVHPSKGGVVLREHLAGHKGEKTHGCSLCPQAFNWRSSFYAHMEKDHPQEWQKIQNEELQRKFECGYWRETRENCLVYICIYCFKEYDKRISVYRHIRRIHGSVRPKKPKKEFRTETRRDLKVYVCNHCATEYEDLDSMYHHLNQYHKIDASLAEKASTISESPVPAKKVEIKPKLDINQQEVQLKWHNVMGLSASNENFIKPKALTFDIKSEEPLDLNSDYEGMSFQVQHELTDEETSYLSSRNHNNDVVSNDDYSPKEVLPLSSSNKKLPAAKRSVEEFDELVALWRFSLECEICHQLVPSYSQLQEHFSKNHTSVNCYLMCCHLRLETRFDIDRHIRYHNAPQQLKCEACCKSYGSEKQLKVHKRQVHTSKGGDKNAKSKDIKKLEGKYRCCKCSKGFASEKHLHVHNQNVHKPKNLECNLCEKSFRRPASLRDHLAGHRGEKMHACFFCPKAYTWRHHCCQHMRKSHTKEWQKMQKVEVQREPKYGYRRETQGGSKLFVCIYCFKEYDNRRSIYYHVKRCQIYNTPVEPKKGYRIEARGKSKVHVCLYCAKEYEKRHSMYQHLNQYHRDDGSLAEEQASMISELPKPAENVEIKPELNKNPEESQQNCHNDTSSENVVKPKAFTFDIKTEEPWDLNNDYKRMSPQGLDQLTDEEISLMSYMSSKNENSFLKNDDASIEKYGANDDISLSPLGQTKLPASKMSVEEFDELVALWRSSLKCEICHQLVASYSQLKEHFSENHASEACYLMCCQLRLETRFDIDRHMYYHNAPQQLRCDACCKAFRLEKHLRDHKRQFHTSKGADKIAKDMQRLQGEHPIMKRYRREIRGESMVYVCLYCSSEYDKQNSIYGHLKHCQRDYDGEIKPIKGFRLEIREEGKVFVCIYCSKDFKNRISMLNHTSECRRGKAQTKPKKGYRRETRGESRVYVCNYCSKAFKMRLAMYKHIKRCLEHVMPIKPRKGYRQEVREENSMVYVCIFCSKEYANRQSMYYHLYNIHRDETSLAKQSPIISEIPVPKLTEVSNITTNGDSFNELSKEEERKKEDSLMTELKDENVTKTNVKNEQLSINTNALGNEEKNENE